MIRTPVLILRKERGFKRILGALALWAALAFASLFSYVCMCLDYVFFPGVRRVVVRAPIFIVGNGRSGTTQMHRLITGDAQHMSFFKTYELILPSLLQRKMLAVCAALDRLLLGERVSRYLRAKHDTGLTEVRTMHDWQMDGAEEDDLIMLHNFSAMALVTFFPYVYEYLDLHWTDRRPARTRRRIMGFYKATLQRQIYWTGIDRVHCCKSPAFTLKVQALRETFPDARFVVMVRNPAETLPSLEHLMQWYWRKQGCDPALSEEAATRLSELQMEQYRYVFDALTDVPAHQQCVVHFPDLLDDPKAVVERIYARFGLLVSPQYEAYLNAERAKARQFVSRHAYEQAPAETRARYNAALPELAARYNW